MKLAQKVFLLFENELNVGGIDNLPPTLCLRPAHPSAHVSAYVECTGMAGTKKLEAGGTMSPVMANSLFYFWRQIHEPA
ncbi:MAG: hypothetical protein HZB50_03635 [Chloroflexi bacterium]|nr:hypothetical protein [Chloroflexota bacterium]